MGFCSQIGNKLKGTRTEKPYRKEIIMQILKPFFFRSILIVLGLLLGTTSSWATCQLSVGWDPWPPYLFVDDKGQLTGLDKEIATAIAKEAKCTLVFKKRPWKRQLRDVQNGEIDCVTGASKNPKREKYAYFSNAYRSEFVALFVRKGESGKYQIQSLADIPGKSFRLGLSRGYFYGEQYERLSKNQQFNEWIQLTKGDEQNYKKLIKNRIEGSDEICNAYRTNSM